MNQLSDFVGYVIANFNMIQGPQEFRSGFTNISGLATWAPNQASVSTPSFLAPDGTNTAESLIENSASSEHQDITSLVPVGSSNWDGIPFRVWLIAKAGTRTRCV